MSLVDFKWYALQVRPKWEQRVARVLSLKGYTVFAPTFTIRKPGRPRGSDTTAPIFPAYVLCRYEATVAHRMVDSPCVIRLVGYGHTPTPVDDREMASLQLLYASGLPSYPWQYYRRGQRIRVTSGALAGVEGYFVRIKGTDRVIVNLTILQRSIMVEFDGAMVEALPSVPEPAVVAHAWRERIRGEAAAVVA